MYDNFLDKKDEIKKIYFQNKKKINEYLENKLYFEIIPELFVWNLQTSNILLLNNNPWFKIYSE